jgi:preprotein translocase subunit SecG
MTLVITVLHVFVCIFLVAVVLLQRGKGAEIGAVFGSGASSTVFGGRGAGTFLTKLTTGCAIVFMLTSLTLSYVANTVSSDALFQDGVEQEAPAGDTLFEEFGTVAPEEPGAAEAAPPGEAEGDLP